LDRLERGVAIRWHSFEYLFWSEDDENLVDDIRHLVHVVIETASTLKE
jgi:hypothetical protein